MGSVWRTATWALFSLVAGLWRGGRGDDMTAWSLSSQLRLKRELSSHSGLIVDTLQVG
jgi:hypothetical protein